MSNNKTSFMKYIEEKLVKKIEHAYMMNDYHVGFVLMIDVKQSGAILGKIQLGEPIRKRGERPVSTPINVILDYKYLKGNVTLRGFVYAKDIQWSFEPKNDKKRLKKVIRDIKREFFSLGNK